LSEEKWKQGQTGAKRMNTSSKSQLPLMPSGYFRPAWTKEKSMMGAKRITWKNHNGSKKQIEIKKKEL